MIVLNRKGRKVSQSKKYAYDRYGRENALRHSAYSAVKFLVVNKND